MIQTFLDQIRQEKQPHLEQRKQGLAKILQHIETQPKPPCFASALLRQDKQNPVIISEIKPKAPGRVNAEVIDVQKIVTNYEQGGASALSVLTDDLYFGGSLELLQQVAKHTKLPLLNKEFIFDEFQLLEARAFGASAVLILTHYFDEPQLKTIIQKAKNLDLTPVVECSIPEELPRALSANPQVLLINNRPISKIPANPQKTYQQGSVQVSIQWWHDFPELQEWKALSPDQRLISASCIESAEDVTQLAKFPYDAVLIGNSAMTASDPVTFLKQLTS